MHKTHALQFGKFPLVCPSPLANIGAIFTVELARRPHRQRDWHASSSSAATAAATAMVALHCHFVSKHAIKIFKFSLRTSGEAEAERIKGWAQSIGALCALFKQTHAPNELQSAHNSTKNAVQFLNCLLAKATAQCPSERAQCPLPDPRGRVRKMSAFWSPKTICFPNGISIYVCCMLCTHFRKCTYLPTSATLRNDAHTRPRTHTHTLRVLFGFGIGCILKLQWVFAAMVQWCSGAVVRPPHYLFRFCGPRLEHFVT